jgi:hypothetical protein
VSSARTLGDRLEEYGRDAPLDLRWPFLLISVCAAFLGAYAIGSATRPRPTGAGRPLGLAVTSIDAPIQLTLASLPPIELLPARRTHQDAHRRHAKPSTPVSGAGVTREAPSQATAPAQGTIPQPTAPPPSSSPVAKRPSSAGRSPAPTGRHRPSGSSTGSFDSSG